MKKIFNLLLLLAAMTLYTACTPEVDDVFPESSSQRMTNNLASTKEVLQSAPNGWIMRMYGNTDFGGYNVMCKFEGDYVTVMNELYGSDRTAKSHYKLEQSAGMILSFDEYNELFHFFSNPANPNNMGENGKGFLGDLEFRVIKAEADSIVMLGKKHDARVVMVPAPADWAGYIKKVKDMEDNISSANYILTVDGLKMSTITEYRCFQATDTIGFITKLPYIITDTGIEFYKTYTVNGKPLKAFDCTKGNVWAEISDPTTTLQQIIVPLNQQLAEKTWYFSYSNIGSYGKPYWDQYLKGENSIGEVLQSASFGKCTLEENTFGYEFMSLLAPNGRFRGSMYYTYKFVGDDKIVITFTGEGDKSPGNGLWYYRNAALNYALFPLGIDPTKPKTFKLETDRIANPSYILMTDVDNANNTFKLSAKTVTLPFSN